MTQAVLPQMRERGNGVIVNVTSAVTVKALSLVGVYSASKAAMNAFTESLAIEVAPLGVRVRLVLPGRAPTTRFGENAFPHLGSVEHPAYAPLVQGVLSSVRDSRGPVTMPQAVAEAVWRAVTDENAPMRIPGGDDAVEWMYAEG